MSNTLWRTVAVLDRTPPAGYHLQSGARFHYPPPGQGARDEPAGYESNREPEEEPYHDQGGRRVQVNISVSCSSSRSCY